MEKTKDGFILSSGRRIGANNNIIGLSEPTEEEGWTISEGYDGTLFMAKNPEYTPSGGGLTPLTPEELVEIADYMIALWQRFKDDYVRTQAKP